VVGKKQFDVGMVLDAAMIQFWRNGHAATSVDDLSRATGLNRSSLYSSFGDKDELFMQCLQRYVARYGGMYDTALSCAADQLLQAVEAFFEVTLERIADPELPDGCLVAQTVMAATVLRPIVARRAQEAVGVQRTRLHAALTAGGLPERRAEAFALHLAAVNQSLAVMSRSGAGREQLRVIVDVTLNALAQTLPVNAGVMIGHRGATDHT
jgi:AcrR family transcriptional regulator